MKRIGPSVAVLLLSGALVVGGGQTEIAAGAALEPEPQHVGIGNAILESIWGDVYAEPSRWRPLSLGTFFTEGWDEAWASPPTGKGGAPRQGWLNTFDGVFYRLVIGTYGYAHGFGGDGEQHTGGGTLYLPFNRRFELRTDISIVSSPVSGPRQRVAAGDMFFWTRLLLSECESFRASRSLSTWGSARRAVTPTWATGSPP